MPTRPDAPDAPDVRFVTAAQLPAPDPDTAPLAAELRDRGLRVAIDDWRDPNVDWAGAPLTVLRSPWDYVERLDEFLAWAEHTATVSALWNPFALIAWNTHKAYLLELASAGAPVVPSVLLPRHSAAALDGIADAQGWNTVVVKPAVGIGAQGAGRFELGAPDGQAHLDDLLTRGDVLVQPYAPEIAEQGELSLVCVDGVVTHAVRKIPRAGDFRIHERYGGALEAAAPSAALRELGARVVAALPTPTLYARVDVVSLAGQWHVLEVEVTEPRLYLEFGPAAATTALVDAIVARMD
jgi:glutathione synthase/RimK-type ligase-like ATP-grasp enzyme